MNVMKKAHELTRNAMAQVDKSICVITYKQAFSVYLREAHRMNKEAQTLKAQTIAQFEQRIVELQMVLNGPDAQKYMVVCGDDHPMPINFEAKDPKWPWSSVEGATKWNSRQFAEANASKVVNGLQQVGKAVRVDHHCEWDMINLSKLINDLTA